MLQRTLFLKLSIYQAYPDDSFAAVHHVLA